MKNIQKAKRKAKLIKSELGITHVEALDIIAVQHGFNNWSLLSKNSKKSYDDFMRDIIASNDRSVLNKSSNQIEDHGYRYLILEILWLLPIDVRRELSFDTTPSWFFKFRKRLSKYKLLDNMGAKITSRLTELDAWRQDTPARTMAIGSIFHNVFMNYKEAEDAYKKAIEFNPLSAEAWYGLGLSLAYNQRPENAETAFLKVIEIRPSFIDAICELGIVYNRQASFDKAFNLLKKAIESNNERPLWLLAHCLHPLKNLGNVAFGRSEDFLGIRIAIALVFSRSLRSENASSDEIAWSHCCDVQSTLLWIGRYWSRTAGAVGT